MNLHFVSWFAGIGGFDLALNRAGFTCAGACEIDTFAREVYTARLGAPSFFPSDIREVKPDDVPDADLWCGGFPCQDLSSAGKRAGWQGERSVLVFDLLRLAAERRPTWLLLENVPGILSVRGGLDFGVLLAALDDAGYLGCWRVLDARWFGVPQRRRRVFILARRAGVAGPCPSSVLLEPEGVRRDLASRGTTGESVAGALTSGACKRGRKGATNGEAASECLIPFDLAQVTSTENRTACRPGDPAPTLAATGRPHVASRMAVRRLTPTECERLQGFPDGWTAIPWVRLKRLSPIHPVAPDGARYRVLGNAVAVPVVEWIARRLQPAVETRRECECANIVRRHFPSAPTLAPRA